MAVKDVSKTSLKIFNPFALYITPYRTDTEKGTDVYVLKDVIKDSTSLVQDDPETQKIESEFSSSPLRNITTLGSYQFACQVGDMQQELLNILCGFTKGTTATDLTFAPDAYVPVYAEIALVFQISQGKYAAVVLPYVLLNSKTTFESLSSNMGVISFAGTALSGKVTDGVKTITTPAYIDGAYELPE